MRIGELADQTGERPRTIRYYERLGLLRAAPRRPNGYRDYEAITVERLAFIRAAQAVGFTLAQIHSIIAIRDDGEAPCAHVQALISRRVADIDRCLDELQHTRAELTRLAERADRLDPAVCRPDGICDIISAG